MRLLAEEDFRGVLTRTLRRRLPTLDLITASEAGLLERHDRLVLAWAAEQGRVLLTSDRSTMPGYAYERVRAGLGMPGVVVVRQRLPVALAVDELLILIECSLEDELENQVRYLPLE